MVHFLEGGAKIDRLGNEGLVNLSREKHNVRKLTESGR